MKSKIFFRLSNFLNFIFSSIFVCLAIYAFVARRNSEKNMSISILFILIFLLIVVPFNWLCFSLHNIYQSSLQLSKKAKAWGTFFFILFSVLAALQIIGSVEIIADLISNPPSRTTGLLLFALLFSAITITSVYLCISYWFIRRQSERQFINVIAQLGAESVI